MSRVLITGGGGFIGHHLAAHFRERHEVNAPRREELDLLDAGAVGRYLDTHRFDVVIHAATERSNRAAPGRADLLSRNCRMFFHLARHEQAFGRMLFLSSGAIYDRSHWQPRMPEEYCGVHVPADDYGLSKYACAQTIAGLSRTFELRLFGVFGPGEDWRVRFLSNACCRAAWGLPIVIRQNVFFDYMDIADLGWVLEAFLKNEPRSRHYNVCTGRAFDLRTLAGMVLEACEKTLPVVVKNEGLGQECSGDNTSLLEEIPDFQFREMRDSIGRLYHWYEMNRSAIDPRQLEFDGTCV